MVSMVVMSSKLDNDKDFCKLPFYNQKVVYKIKNIYRLKKKGTHNISSFAHTLLGFYLTSLTPVLYIIVMSLMVSFSHTYGAFSHFYWQNRSIVKQITSVCYDVGELCSFFQNPESSNIFLFREYLLNVQEFSR